MSNGASTQISVIIVTYNTAQVTAQCIDSIFRHTEGIGFEVIVVDNASSDGTKDTVGTDSRIRYILNSENLGFGQANNIGMREAKGEYLFLLNSDTLLTGNALRTLYDQAAAYGPKLGAMGMILQSAEGRDVHSFGSFPTVSDALFAPYRRSMNRAGMDPAAEEVMKVDYVTGADMLVPRSVFEESGGFDPVFFMYCEEADWQKRMQERGLDRVIIPFREIIHLEGGSEGKASKGWSFNRYRNATVSRIKYLKKHCTCISYTAFRILFPIFRLPVVAASSYSCSQKLRLTKDLFVKL